MRFESVGQLPQHAWNHLPCGFWRKVPGELMAAEPSCLFVGGFCGKLLSQRSPDLRDYIEEPYRPIWRYKTSRWCWQHESRPASDSRPQESSAAKAPGKTDST